MYKSLDLYVAVHSQRIHDPSMSSIEQSTIVDYAAAATTAAAVDYRGGTERLRDVDDAVDDVGADDARVAVKSYHIVDDSTVNTGAVTMRSTLSSVAAAATALSSSPLPSSLSSVAVDVVTVTESSIGQTTQHDVDSSEDSIDSVVMIGRTVRADAKAVNTSSGSNGTIVVDKLTSLLKGDLHLKQQLSIVNGGEITIDKGMKTKPIPSSPIASLSDSNDSLQASSDPTDDDDNGRGVGYCDDDHDDDEDDEDEDEDRNIDESSDNDEVESYHNKNNNHHHDDGNKRDSTSINNTVHKNSSNMQTVDKNKSSDNKKGPKIKNYVRKRASKQHHQQQQQQQQSRFITFYRYVERMIVQSLIFRQVKRRLQVLTKYIRVLFVTMTTRNTKRESLLFAILYSVSIVILMHVLSKLASTITTLYISHYSTIQSDDVLRILNIHHDGTIVINTSSVVNRTTDHYSSIMNILRPITSSTRSSSSLSSTSSPLPTSTISSSSSSYIDASAYQTTVVVPTHWVRDGESISFGDFTHLNHDLNNIHTLDRVTNILPTAALKDRVVERYQWTRDGENGLWMLRHICLFSTHHDHHLSSCSS